MVTTGDTGPSLMRPLGREDVLAQLRSVVDHATDVGGRLAVITGEAGIGKTTLLANLARHAEKRGARVAWGWGWPGAGAPAFWPWLQVLSSLGLGFPATPCGADAPDSSRFQLFDEVCGRLVEATRDQPLVVLLDDLHWADLPSLLLLDFLGARLPTARLGVVAALRPNVSAPDATLTAIAARATVLALAGLSQEAVAALLTEALGASRANDLAADVRRRTGGNPFFVQQLGWLIRDGRPGIPQGVRESLGQRLAQLAPIHLDVIGLAAVAGQEFTTDLLVRASPEPAAPVSAALTSGVAIGVLREDEPGVFRFVHDLFREYLYDRMAPGARASAHRRVGRAMEDLRPDASASELAWHFLQADPGSAKARGYSVAAARDATERLAYEDAVRHWEWALAGTVEPSDRLDILLRLAESRRRAGAGRTAEGDFRAAADVARAIGDNRGLAHVALGLHAVGTRPAQPPPTVRAGLGGDSQAGAVRQSPEDLAAILAEAGEALRGSGEDQLLHLRVLAGLARVLAWYDLDFDRAHELAHTAVATARDTGDLPVLAACLLAEHNCGWAAGSTRRRRDIADELSTIAGRIGDGELAIEAELLLATDLLELGDPTFRVRLDTFARRAGASPLPHLRYAALVRQAMLAQLAGRLDEAADLAGRARERGAAEGIPDAEEVWLTQMWELRTAQNRQAEVIGSFEPDSRAARGGELLERALNGVTGLTAGQVTQLLDAADRPAPGSRRYVVDLTFAAEAVSALADPASVERVYRALLPYADLTAVSGAAVSFRGAIAHHLGTLAAAAGRTADAHAHLSAAIETHTRLGIPVWTVRSRFALARLPGARSRGDLAGIAAEAARLGLAGVAAEARAVPVAGGEFTHNGSLWTLAFDGTQIRMRDSKGLRDLAILLAVPGRAVPAIDLISATGGDLARADLALGADEVFDATARQQIRARLRDLDDEITDAEHHANPERSRKAAAEKRTLLHELAAATGLRGSARRLGDQGERARKTTTARIRDIIARIERSHPSLGAHLRASVTTGTYCGYSPAAPVTWRL